MFDDDLQVPHIPFFAVDFNISSCKFDILKFILLFIIFVILFILDMFRKLHFIYRNFAVP